MSAREPSLPAADDPGILRAVCDDAGLLGRFAFKLPSIADIWNHPANRSRQWRAIGRSVFWQAWKKLMRQPLTVDYHGLRFRCHPDSRQASAAIYFHGWPDYWEMRFVSDYLRPGDGFLDIGANIGLYSLLAASIVGPSGRVMAFEPGRIPADRLRDACIANRLENIALVRSGVGEHTGELTFDAGSEDATAHVAVADEISNTRVPAIRLDEYLDDTPIAMAKLDIEGYEPFALRGMSRLLASGNPPVFLMEAAGYSKRYGIETHDLIHELEAMSYRPMFYDPDHRELLPADSHWEMGLTNVLCVFDGARDLVSKRIVTSWRPIAVHL